MTIRERIEPERLRSEKDFKEEEKRTKANAISTREGPTTSTADHKETQSQQNGGDGHAERRGYEPDAYADAYGSDDPYRRQEDVERERAAQQAAATALSPASGPVLQPKARPTPKAVLGRGQEEAVEAGTGARVIQKRHVPPAPVIKLAPQEREQARQHEPAPMQQRQDATTTKSVAPEKHTKAHNDPPRALLVERPRPGAQIPGELESGNGPQTSNEKSREETSSVSLQWLTPRRDVDSGGGEARSQSQRGPEQSQHKGAPSAWTQPVSTITVPQASPGKRPGASNVSTQLDRFRGKGPQEGKGAGESLPGRSPRLRPGEGGHQFQHHDGRNAGYEAGKNWPAPGVSPGSSRPAIGTGDSLGQKPHPPPSSFDKEAGHSFSSLFAGPGQHERGEVQRSGSFASSGGGEGHAIREGLGRDWAETGHGPPSREPKRIFDHKTGKMRDVEVRHPFASCRAEQ